MVYIKEWTKFESAAVELYAQSPRKTRYCVKFTAKTGQLVLKLTDDRTCLKYKSHSAIILNRFDALSLRLLSLQANARRRPPAPTAAAAGAAAADSAGGTPAVDRDDPMGGGAAAAGAGAGAVPPAAGGASAAAKKKKKKGKK